MHEVCDVCGSMSNPQLMATCSECKEISEHIYCMLVLRVDMLEEWCCELCKLTCKAISSPIKDLSMKKSKVKFLPMDEIFPLTSGCTASTSKSYGLSNSENRAPASDKSSIPAKASVLKLDLVTKDTTKMRSIRKCPFVCRYGWSIKTKSSEVDIPNQSGLRTRMQPIETHLEANGQLVSSSEVMYSSEGSRAISEDRDSVPATPHESFQTFTDVPPLPPRPIGRPYLELLPNGGFASTKYASEITKIFKAYNNETDYRWTHLSPQLQEKMFDTFLERFTILPEHSKEEYRPAFTKCIMKRMTDVYYRARTKALEMCSDKDSFDEAKEFPPPWCPKERWSVYCDKFKIDKEFNVRSTAGKANREKQEIRSCTGSKSHDRVRGDLERELGRPATVAEWWPVTHTNKEKQWSTPAAYEVQKQFNERKKRYNELSSKTPPSEMQIWNEVVKERKVGSVSRKQVLGGLHTDFVASSSRSSCARYTSPLVIEEVSKTRLMMQELESKIMTQMTEQMTALAKQMTQILQQQTSSHSKESDTDMDGDTDGDTDISDYRIRRTKKSHHDHYGKKKKHR